MNAHFDSIRKNDSTTYVFYLIEIFLLSFTFIIGCDSDNDTKPLPSPLEGCGQSKEQQVFKNTTNEFQWQETEIPCKNVGFSVIFCRRRSHPFLAEYDMKVILQPQDGEPIHFEFPWAPGGRKIDVYEIRNKEVHELWFCDTEDVKNANVIDLLKHSFRIEGERRLQLEWKNECFPVAAPVEIPKEAKLIGTILPSKNGNGITFKKL